ncbi:MAG: tyrosine--tRNA ligase [Candidatus Thermoplasmatota archaeon]|jgi:tyrosyl-tRNA synthetase|nr:tyrosine--tRNA ligase [Candidatus Thermoplasmatota archaeon]MCL5790682.1 tyrosine--tRNA ligase [Candidatus Thermoplasmatota archaeon]
MLQIDRNLFQEIVTEEEFDRLSPGCTGYIGFEPSGIPHIAQILLVGERIRALSKAGVKMTILLADWHAMINDKLGGDLQEIRKSGELMKKAFEISLSGQNISYLWASELIDRKGYLEGLIRTAKATTLSRLKRALPIMGRTENDAESDFSKFIYPVMQVNDIAMLDVDIAMGGMDQRHAHMLQRDVAEKMGIKKVKALHTPLMSSLKGSGRMDSFQKMSKSDPDGAILITDSEDDIRRKMKGAYCPQGIAVGNPVMEIIDRIIMPAVGTVRINRPEKKGGPLSLESSSELLRHYTEGQIHPVDLKAAAADYLVQIMRPYSGLLKE